MNRSYYLIALMIISFSFSISAQDSLLVSELQANISTFQVSESSISGDAFEVLEEEIRQNQFLLIGESHGIAEIGLFTKLLFENANKEGFEHLVIETDPYGAEKLMSIVKEQNYLDIGKSFFSETQFSIPFYNTVGDLQLIHSVNNLSKAEHPIWGIDQVFMASPRLIFSQMASKTRDQSSKSLALEYLKKAKDGFQKVIDEKRFDHAYMLHFGKDDYEALVTKFEAEPNLVNMIDGLQKSKDIYMYNFTGKIYENNLVRSKLMKSQFLDYYNKSKANSKLPKAIFRLGANHCGRGLNYTNVFDIGNMVSELAAINNSSSFHIKIGGIKGTQNQFIPIAPKEAKKSPYNGLSNLDIHIQKAIEQHNNDEWLMIDFRPLRRLHRKKLAKADEKLKDLIFNYDVLILIPDVHATTFLTDYSTQN